MRKLIKEFSRSIKASLSYAIRYAGMLSIVVIVLSVLLSLTPYLNSYGLKILLNALESTPKSELVSIDIIQVIILFSLLVTLPEILKVVFELINKIWTFRIFEKIEALVLHKIIEVELIYHESSAFQNLMQRAFHKGVYPLLDLTRLQYSTIRYGVSFVLGSVIAINISPLAYLLILLSAIPQLAAQYKYGKGIWHIRAEDSPEQRRFSDLKRYFSTPLVIMETKLFQTGPKLIEWLQSILRKFHSKHTRFERKKVLYATGAEIFYLIGNAVSLYLLLMIYVEGDWKLGDFVFAIGVFSGTATSIRDLFLIVTKQYEEHLSVRDILEFLDTPTYDSKDYKYESLKLEESPEIVFEDVWFKYPSTEKWVLKGISFTLDKNKTAALVGANGCGKSTITKLLCKIYEPSRGKIYVNGYNLKDIEVESWRSNVAVLLQDSIDYHFPTELAIGVGDINKPLDHDLVLRSAHLSTANTFIEKWEEKYKTPLGVVFDGKAPSKGQKQKLAFAKTIYRNGFLSIFDEPTTSMDADSVSFIAKNLKEICKDKSVIIISHDITLTSHCDEVILVKDGTVALQGTHSELLKDEYYRGHIISEDDD